MTLNEKLSQAVWVAHSIYDRGKTSGSSANISFIHDGVIYISASGTCFGSLTEDDFAVMTPDGTSLNSKKCSREFGLHKTFYTDKNGIGAVIHTHSTFATLWSCLKHENRDDLLPAYTPYLKMRLGDIRLVPYAPPGSEELFAAFRERVCDLNGYLLQNHGPIVGGKDILDAYYSLEELEESAHIAWLLRNEPNKADLTIK